VLENLESVAIVNEQAVARTYPHEPGAVLVDGSYHFGGKALLASDMLEANLSREPGRFGPNAQGKNA
jgi:hypothetical protein